MFEEGNENQSIEPHKKSVKNNTISQTSSLFTFPMLRFPSATVEKPKEKEK